jgi:transcriptional regulator with XRE-family HTH domain
MENNQQIIIGRNIKSFRNTFGFTQDHLAELVGTSRGVINYYEKGTRPQSILHLSTIADLFGIELIDLMENDENALKLNSLIAFKKDVLVSDDRKAISEFRKIAKNYVKMIKNF